MTSTTQLLARPGPSAAAVVGRALTTVCARDLDLGGDLSGLDARDHAPTLRAWVANLEAAGLPSTRRSWD